MALAHGARLGAYEIVERLGAGGMGEVYRARDTRLGRDVAIKVIAERLIDDPGALARFEREAQAIAALSHPNILALHDFGRDKNISYAVMELLEGETLDRRLSSERFTWRKSVEIGAAIADGLASAHARNIVHHDLKPSNIFITRDGLVKILDFGLATREPHGARLGPVVPDGSFETQPDGPVGTIGYMSPEQVMGETGDHRSDIFALGCVLYEMLAGRPAFRRDTPQESLAAIVKEQPPDLDALASGVPPRVNALVLRCLEKDRDPRFQSARDLAFALREAVTDAGAAARSFRSPLARSASARGWIAAAMVLLLAATVAIAVPSIRSRLMPPGSPSIRSIAVLPLVNLSPDREQEYFADAMTEELTTRLSNISDWRVTSRTSVMGYRDTRKKIPEIARELGVDAIVEGSVLRDGSRVKITAQLIDGRTDRHLWADSYERNVESVLAIQSDVARAIANGVNLKLTPEGHARLAADARAVVPAAYDAYVRGRHAWEKRSEADLRQAIRFFEESTDADPTYAPAYAGLADCYGQLGYGSYISPDDAFPRAREAARKAIQIDPLLGEAHASLAFSLMYYDWNFASAEAEFRRAIELSPNYAIAHQWYAYLLTAMERPIGEATGEIATARSLDPLSVPINLDEAYILYYYERTDAALHAASLALEMNPSLALAHFWLGRIYTSQRRYAEAEAELKKIGPLRTWTPGMSALGYLYGKSGRSSEAAAILKEFEDLSRAGRYASSYAIGVIYAGLEDRERALAALDAAYRERSHWLVWLKRDPRWNEIRSDSRFSSLVRKVGLPN